jgi:hypothetical protein
MILSQFMDALDCYGSALEQWPDSERRAAEALLAISPEAVAELAAARRVEAFVRDNDPAATLGPDAVVRLTNTVLARLPAQARAQQRVSPWRDLLGRLGLSGPRLEWAPRFAMSMAVAAVLGVAAGDHLLNSTTQQVSASELLAMSNSYLPLDLR